MVVVRSKLKQKPVNKIVLNTVFGGEDKLSHNCEEGKPQRGSKQSATIRTKETKNDPTAPLTIPNKLTKPDILIQNTKDLYSKIKKETYCKKILDSLGYMWENNNLDRALE
jgi:hypothetical protein